jgi:hypothetical protein
LQIYLITADEYKKDLSSSREINLFRPPTHRVFLDSCEGYASPDVMMFPVDKMFTGVLKKSLFASLL